MNKIEIELRILTLTFQLTGVFYCSLRVDLYTQSHFWIQRFRKNLALFETFFNFLPPNLHIFGHNSVGSHRIHSIHIPIDSARRARHFETNPVGRPPFPAIVGPFE